MATAILSVNIENLPLKLAPGNQYQKVLLLIRYNGKPVGKITLPVEDGIVKMSRHSDAIINSVSGILWTKKVYDFLQWDLLNTKRDELPKATVVVNTRDRPDDLKRCLGALLSLPDDGQEIMVIDNCPSTNASFDIVSMYPRVRYVREDFPGSSAARNRALKEAKYDLIAFTDDDAMTDSNWLRSIVRNFNDPRVMCVTGQVMPLELENEAQEWFESFSPLGRGFRRIEYDGASSYSRFRVAQIGAGANMAVRRELLKLGGWDEVLGVGTPATCGDDHELFSRILARGYKIVYEPEALSWHRHRRTWQETTKTMFNYGMGVYAFWTRTVIREKEFSAMLLPWRWFYRSQFPNLLRSLLKRKGSIPLDLLLAEMRGCIAGTRAYFKSLSWHRQKTNNLRHG